MTKDTVYKLLPWIVGGAIGWLLGNPPAVFEIFGPWRGLVVGALAGLAVLLFVGAQLLSSLPAEPRITPRPGARLGAEADALAADLRAAGFESIEPPFDLGLRPPATVWSFLHREGRTVGSVFKTGTVPARVGFDLVSVVEEGRGTLTSGSDPRGGILPLPPGCFKQILPGLTPGELFEHHRRAVELLGERWIRFREPRPESLPEEIAASLRAQRSALRRGLISASWLALWRTVRRSTPYLGPIDEQKGYEETVQQLTT